MSKKLIFAIIAIVIVVLGAAFVLWPRPPKGYSGKMETVTIGLPTSIGFATYTIIAQERHFFARNGLNGTIRDYSEGVNALDGLLNGDVDIAGASEYGMVGKAFNGDRVCVIATVSKTGTYFVTGRKDRGIKDIADLKGKRIGVTLHTISEFYLSRFLNLNGIQIRNVTYVNLRATQLEDAIVDGTIDAVISHVSNFFSIKHRLDANGKSWPAQSGQPTYVLATAKTDWVAQRPELVKRFLNSLTQAEEYIINHPNKAKAVTQKRFKFDRASIESVWQVQQFSLSLDQSLIAAMEDEARWMIKNNLTAEKTVPDFGNYIYVDALKAVKPEAVNIIR
jgi:NitT/TauT family transport system substrate-binding protein